MRKRIRGRAVSVVPLDRGEEVELGKGSFSDLVLTSSTLKHNRTMMGYSVFKPGLETKQKVHINTEEMAFVVAGSGKLTVGDDSIPFKKGDSIHIPAGVPHGIRNDGKEDIAMVFFFPTKNYPSTVDA